MAGGRCGDAVAVGDLDLVEALELDARVRPLGHQELEVGLEIAEFLGAEQIPGLAGGTVDERSLAREAQSIVAAVRPGAAHRRPRSSRRWACARRPGRDLRSGRPIPRRRRPLRVQRPAQSMTHEVTTATKWWRAAFMMRRVPEWTRRWEEAIKSRRNPADRNRPRARGQLASGDLPGCTRTGTLMSGDSSAGFPDCRSEAPRLARAGFR